MSLWQTMVELHSKGNTFVLLYVVESKGSSPGRQGFHIILAEDGRIWGTIGGGIMEHKMISWAKRMFTDHSNPVILKRQIHDKKAHREQSGMICSGEQTVAMIYFGKDSKSTFGILDELVTSEKDFLLCISVDGARFISHEDSGKYNLGLSRDNAWEYVELIKFRQIVNIIGAGHVGLAVSKVLRLLDFELHLYDDRTDLHTLSENQYVDLFQAVDYSQISEALPYRSSDLIIVVTSTYRSDKEVLKQLSGRKYRYLGCMGSESKIRQLIGELKEEGVSEDWLGQIKAPIGLDIYSKTATEIAVSIAAEIIFEKNKYLPTGRTKPNLNGEYS